MLGIDDGPELGTDVTVGDDEGRYTSVGCELEEGSKDGTSLGAPEIVSLGIDEGPQETEGLGVGSTTSSVGG